jgi:hypothetical protein
MQLNLGLALGHVTSLQLLTNDQVIARLAHRYYAPGYNSGAAPLTGDGTVKTYISSGFANESGFPISVVSLVFQGWTLRTTGTSDCSAAYPVTGIVEYPAGTPVGTFSATVTPGIASTSVEVTLTTPIPPSSAFVVKVSATPANGATYIQNLGFAGLRTHALKSKLRKIAIGAFGDSKMTNNNSSIANAALGRCPVYVNSIVGTLGSTYFANNAANFQKQLDLCVVLGLTDVVCNFATNDLNGSAVYADLVTQTTAARDQARLRGLRYNHATITPRTNTTQMSDPVSSLTSVGTVLTAVVPDPSKFIIGMFARSTGAAQSEYVGSFTVTAIDNTAKTVTMEFPGSATPTATGTLLLGAWKPTSHAAFMAPVSSKFAAGANSDRGKFNAWVRSGVLDGYLEWADAVESSRDSGRWATIEDNHPYLVKPQTITVSSIISGSIRFNSNYSGGNGTLANGVVQGLTGANRGQFRSGSGNTAGDITLSTAFANAIAANDNMQVIPGVSYFSDDGLHERVAGGGKGGQAAQDAASVVFIAARA